MTTTYSYNQGLLNLTDYNDSTPDVTITYDGYSRQSTVTQTNQSQITYSYNPATLVLASELVKYDIDRNGSYEFTRTLDRSRDSLNRDTGFQLKTGTAVENQAAYSYSATDGRIAQISNPLISNHLFSYSYTPSSNLLASTTGPIHTVTNVWEPTRDVLDAKQNKVGTTVISNYDYAVNAIGQRTGVATSGTAFPAVPSWLWSYDALGQVIAADSTVATSDRTYQYDAIGNRQKTANSLTLPVANNYTANTLNQYTTIQQGGTGVSPVYDFDGNATAYPLPVSPTTNSTLLWDGENRLTEVKNSTGTTIEKNVFDSGSRKIATTANGITTLYLYDGWNCIAEYQGDTGVPPVLKKTRLWGTDLSGSMQGADGVGGMLSESSQITSNPITFSSSYPTYDGNGNVSENLAANGTIAAHFEYDPFGNTVVNTDTANQFAYRFSTKPLAFATGLYYYGYRYYDPLTGLWPSRDPVEEQGGINLYGFVGNNSLSKIDSLGLIEWNMDFTQNLQIGGCIPVPQVPGLQLCVTGGYSITVDGCCKDGEKKQKRSVSGDINFFAQWTPPWIMGLQTFTFSYTKESNIITSYDSECPDPSDAAIGGSIFIGANYYWGNAQCTYSIPSGDWSCSTSAQLARQIDVYGGGSININKTFID